jgi:hypothetical protein
MTDAPTAGQRIIARARQALALARGETGGPDTGSDAYRRSFATAQPSEQEASAIATSRMRCEHAHLDALLDEEVKP